MGRSEELRHQGRNEELARLGKGEELAIASRHHLGPARVGIT